jgi:hypothetical protein
MKALSLSQSVSLSAVEIASSHRLALERKSLDTDCDTDPDNELQD